MKRLEGKKVVITGASSGIGRAVAVACATAGADVAVVARRQDRLEEVAAEIRAAGQQAVICVADVADEAQAVAALEEARAGLGRIDVLVNNAGTNLVNRSIAETTTEEWRRILEINLTSAYVLTKAVLPGMIEQNDGVIINIASRGPSCPACLPGSRTAPRRSAWKR